MRPPPRSPRCCRPDSNLSRVVKILVLRCTASQDIKAKPPGSLRHKVSSVVATPEYSAASPRYTAPLAVFTVLRSSAEIELGRIEAT
jgi:hypothetical protein